MSDFDFSDIPFPDADFPATDDMETSFSITREGAEGWGSPVRQMSTALPGSPTGPANSDSLEATHDASSIFSVVGIPKLPPNLRRESKTPSPKGRKTKRKRGGYACTTCKKAKVKCSRAGNPEEEMCSRCIEKKCASCEIAKPIRKGRRRTDDLPIQRPTTHPHEEALFYRNLGSIRAPRIAKKEVDLYEFYSVVKSIGGYKGMMREGKRAAVFKVLSCYSDSCTDGSNRLKNIYEKYLLPLENGEVEGKAPAAPSTWDSQAPPGADWDMKAPTHPQAPPAADWEMNAPAPPTQAPLNADQEMEVPAPARHVSAPFSDALQCPIGAMLGSLDDMSLASNPECEDDADTVPYSSDHDHSGLFPDTFFTDTAPASQTDAFGTQEAVGLFSFY